MTREHASDEQHRTATTATAVAARASDSSDTSAGEVDRADRVAERLAIPVLLAALAAIPAVFLSLMDEPWGTVGAGLNTLSGAVLIAETVVLLALAEDRRRWLRRNRWVVLLAVVIVPAIVFAVGPVQLLRLGRVGLQAVRTIGALRVIRVGRIIKAGRIVRERTGLDHGWQRAIGILVTVAAAAFVAIVLVDPTSTTRELVDTAVQRLGVFGVLLAGALVAAATYIVRTAKERRSEDGDTPDDSDG